MLHDHRHALDIGIEWQFNKIIPLGCVTLDEMAAIHAKPGSEYLNGYLSRVTLSLPNPFRVLFHGSQVGQRCNLEELAKTGVVVTPKLLHGYTLTASVAARFEVHLARRVRTKTYMAGCRILRSGGLFDRVCSDTRDPRTTSNHLTLSSC
jgi:hypothetical protein